MRNINNECWLLTCMMQGCTNCQVGDSKVYYYKHFNNCGHPKERGIFMANDLTERKITNRTSLVFVKINQDKSIL